MPVYRGLMQRCVTVHVFDGELERAGGKLQSLWLHERWSPIRAGIQAKASADGDWFPDWPEATHRLRCGDSGPWTDKQAVSWLEPDGSKVRATVLGPADASGWVPLRLCDGRL